MMPVRAAAVRALAAILLTAATTAGAQTATDPPSGRYQARPAAVIACGGFTGDCSEFILEGWIEIEVIGLPVVGGPSELRITASDLRFVSPFGGSPFPTADSPQLDELTPGVESGRRVLTTGGHASGATAHLVVVSSRFSDNFLLTGSYFEGCCDRFGYDLGNVLFERLDDSRPTPLRLLGSRFQVEAEWRDFAGGAGFAVPVVLGNRSGRFWFFRPDNPELLVKVVPACEPFGHNWFFAAGLTNVEVTIRVTDTETGVEQTYENPLGRSFEPIQDTRGFPCE